MRKAEIILNYQNVIDRPPVSKEQLRYETSKSDESTMDYFQHVWVGNITANKQIVGSFKDRSVGSEFRKYQNGTAILAGSGPSLKVNAHELKNRGSIPLISCLHNFHYFEDLGLAPEYYVSLDAQEVVIDEVTEGGSKSTDEYWEMTKDRTLVAYIGSPPGLIRRWKGKILFFNSIIPREDITQKIDAIEPFHLYMSSGGNVLGACHYFAKSILGCFNHIFIGADFSFGYDHKFHAWDSKYDKNLGHFQLVTDIFGIKVPTWGTYFGFKCYFDNISLRIPGTYINASEGGCMGAYAEGNLSTFKYMDLKDTLRHFTVNSEIEDAILNPDSAPKKLVFI